MLRRQLGYLSYSFRALCRRPALLVGLTFTIGVGIFATTAVVRAVLESAFLPPSGVTLDGLYTVAVPLGTTEESRHEFALSTLDDLRRRPPEGVRIFSLDAGTRQAIIETAARRVQAPVGLVDGYYAETLTLRAAAGRWINPSDEAIGSSVIVISKALDDLWFSHAAAGPIGQSIRINGSFFTVIGVAHGDFHGLERGVDLAGWIPTSAVRSLPGELPRYAIPLIRPTNRGSLVGIGQEFQGRMLGKAPDGISAALVDLRTALRDKTAVKKALLATAMAALLLLTCLSTVVTLLLARAAERRVEIALRLSLGAPTSAIVTLLSAEATVVAILGIVLGTFVSFAIWWVFNVGPAGLVSTGVWPGLDWVEWLLPSLLVTVVSTVAMAVVTGHLIPVPS